MSIQFARRDACRAVQHGQALLVMLAMLVIGAIAVFYALFSPTSPTLDQDKITAAAMAEVKQALIGWSVARTTTASLPNARPGELPCPDMNNDGSEDGNCSAGALGRVPWKTLGIPEPKDGWGETLWYAVAGPFRIWNTNPNPINSDTKGNITVHLNSNATILTDEAVAVIFAPGPVVQRQGSAIAQNRSCTGDSNLPNCNLTRVCSAPYTATALCNPANYLDVTGGVDNATGPFIQAPDSQTLPSSPPPAPFNDRLLIITTADLIPVVEQRVARELIQALTNYQTATAAIDPGTGEAYCKRWTGEAGCYPWADGGQNGCSDAPPYETATAGAHRGRIPTTGAAPYHWGAPTPTCAPQEEFLPLPSPPPGMPELPAWVINNQWTRVIYYTAGRRFLGPGACHTCQNPSNPAQLRVDEVEKEVVLITPGPAGISGAHTDFPHDYLENPENKDATDNYVTPKSTAYTRDRIFTIP